MQRTRLNTLVNVTQNRFNQLFANPWRRISLSLISFLLGFFLSQAFVTTAGQQAYWDVTLAAFLLIFTESISLIIYRRSQAKKHFLSLDILNLFKVGLTYGLYLEAFKLGS